MFGDAARVVVADSKNSDQAEGARYSDIGPPFAGGIVAAERLAMKSLGRCGSIHVEIRHVLRRHNAAGTDGKDRQWHWDCDGLARMSWIAWPRRACGVTRTPPRTSKGISRASKRTFGQARRFSSGRAGWGRGGDGNRAFHDDVGRGGSFPCQGVAWVGTVKTHRRRIAGGRRRGNAGDARDASDGAERGRWSALMPFRASFYEHFGYGLVERRNEWTLPLAVLPHGSYGGYSVLSSRMIFGAGCSSTRA